MGERQIEALIEELNKAEKLFSWSTSLLRKENVEHCAGDSEKKKVQEGVEVRLMYDGTCSISLLLHNYPKKLEEYGIRCKIFNPIKTGIIYGAE